MPKSSLHNILISWRKYTSIPIYSTCKALVIGSVLLFTSAFVLIRHHPVFALILGITGIVILIAGAAKLDGTSTPSTPKDNLCIHCGMKTKANWKFCAYCTKELSRTRRLTDK